MVEKVTQVNGGGSSESKPSSLVKIQIESDLILNKCFVTIRVQHPMGLRLLQAIMLILVSANRNLATLIRECGVIGSTVDSRPARLDSNPGTLALPNLSRPPS